MDVFFNSPIAAAILSGAGAFFISWLFRRDTSTRQSADEAAHIADLERRMAVIESGYVSKRELEGVNTRLDEIRDDIRDLRRTLEGRRSTE